jgi:integrase
MSETQAVTQAREVLGFDHGVRAYAPSTNGGYWRLRWEEQRRRRDTTAPNRAAAIAKAGEIVERLGRAAPTELGRARGADLVAHYLDPARRPPRVKQWSDRHRDEQTRYGNLYVLPVIATVPCRELTRVDFQHILNQARTASVAQHVRRCLTGIVAAGLEEGHLLLRQDPLRGVRWHGQSLTDRDPADRAVTQAEIPTMHAVHALARASAERSLWWRELLQILLVAYSGLRWGEHAALTAAQLTPTARRITVDRQVVETRSALKAALPKGRRRRVTMYPATTPAGVDLAAMVERRLAELAPDGLLFPAPQGGWLRRSNYAAACGTTRPTASTGPVKTTAGCGPSTVSATCSPAGPSTTPASPSKTSPGCSGTHPPASPKTSTSTSATTCTTASTTPLADTDRRLGVPSPPRELERPAHPQPAC